MGAKESRPVNFRQDLNQGTYGKAVNAQPTQLSQKNWRTNNSFRNIIDYDIWPNLLITPTG